MGTRSLIGKLNDDGTVTAVYCHWGGYISNNGAILNDHYQDAAKVDALLALGDLSSLGNEVGEQHDFDWRMQLIGDPSVSKAQIDNDPRHSWCNAYGRDRGETGTEAHVEPTEVDFWASRKKYGAEYLYLFSRDEWRVKAYDNDVESLRLALSKNEEEE